MGYCQYSCLKDTARINQESQAACCKISIKIGFAPLTKHSTAITIKMSPMSRIITLFPVSPMKWTNLVDVRRIRAVIRKTKAMIKIRIAFLSKVSIREMHLFILIQFYMRIMRLQHIISDLHDHNTTCYSESVGR